MRKVVISIMVVLGVLAAVGILQDKVGATSRPGMERGCVPQSGAPSIFTPTSAASVDSGALDDGTNYWLYCTEDVWIRFGATEQTAQAYDFPLSSKTYWPFTTAGDINHVAAKAQSTTATCFLHECR